MAASAALALVPGLAGCGGKSDRDRVAAYLRQANDVQRRAAPRFERANQAYLDFSKGKLGPADARSALASAERSIRDTREDLAAVKPPAPARRLHKLLLAVLDADADFARESTLLAGYVPRSTAAVKPLPRLTKALRLGLRRKTPEAQARALGAYAGGIDDVVGHLTPLHPPPVLFDRHGDEIRRLRSVASLSRRLRAALRERDSKGVAALLRRFRTVNAGDGGGSAFTGAAVDAYNKRYRQLAEKQQVLATERRRVERQYR
jgi:hypothetical protein